MESEKEFKDMVIDDIKNYQKSQIKQLIQNQSATDHVHTICPIDQSIQDLIESRAFSFYDFNKFLSLS